MSWLGKESSSLASGGGGGGGGVGKGGEHISSRGLHFKMGHGDGDRDGGGIHLWKESGIIPSSSSHLIRFYRIQNGSHCKRCLDFREVKKTRKMT